jgi:hypothetical protein
MVGGVWGPVTRTESRLEAKRLARLWYSSSFRRDSCEAQARLRRSSGEAQRGFSITGMGYSRKLLGLAPRMEARAGVIERAARGKRAANWG